jgi:membrane fusion protein, multidrug efflux system
MRFRSILFATLLIAAAGAGGVYALQERPRADAPRADHPAARAPVPVSIAPAARRDLPIYLTGLGTVQAQYTVGIHSQVDGKIVDVLFSEGQHVNKGDVLVKIDPRLYQAALDQAKAHKAQDQAALVAAEKDLVRFSTLVAKSFETQQNLDLQQAKVDQAKASIAADEAAIETAQTNLDYTTIAAPTDGRIGVRLVDPGNLVRASDQGSIAMLTRVQPITVLFTLPAQSLDDVRAALARGPVEVTAFDRDNRNALATGKLLLIDNLIDQTTSTIRLKAEFANADEKLWPGEFVNARVKVDTRADALVVPSSAVQRGPQGLFAWVIDQKNAAHAQKIEIGPATDDVTIVESGLADGQRVVTDGQYKLQQGATVSITTPATAREGDAS